MKQLLVLLMSAVLLTSCLTAKVQKQSTAELRLRHSQLQRMLSTFRTGDRLVEDATDYENEIVAVEKELLRRYQAGERSAYLPQFGQ